MSYGAVILQIMAEHKPRLTKKSLAEFFGYGGTTQNKIQAANAILESDSASVLIKVAQFLGQDPSIFNITTVSAGNKYNGNTTYGTHAMAVGEGEIKNYQTADNTLEVIREIKAMDLDAGMKAKLIQEYFNSKK